MKELIAIFEDFGTQRIKTYIQSGNVIFQIPEKNLSQLSKQVADEIKKRRGFEPYILILGLDEIEKVIQENPFPETQDDSISLHLGFLASAPKNPDLEKLNSLKKESEQFHLIDNVLYLYAPEGVGKSKLAANMEKVLGVPLTDRNWKTVRKIRDIAQELDS